MYTIDTKTKNNYETLNKILTDIPSTCGYIINDKKLYGKQYVKNQDSVKLISVNDRHLHKWFRKGYTEFKLKTKETDHEGWTTQTRRKLLKSRFMRPCPAELHNNGQCLERYNTEHKKFFYHFSKVQDNKLTSKNGKILCKYSDKCGKNKCWELHNVQHMSTFYHN